MNNAAFNQFPDDALDAIAAKVCDVLIRIQVAHPDWIHIKARHISLAENKAKLSQKLSAILHRPLDQPNLVEQVIHFLEKLLDPVAAKAFYPKLQNFLVTELSAGAVLIQQPDQLQTVRFNTSPPVNQPQREFCTQKLAILLLDAENIDLNQAAETWIESQCNHPLSLKFAFGNWKKLGDRDADLHQRGYHLIHVPDGKNHADAKMTMIGSSIWVHLPTIQEAIVCSNDHGLENLRHTLRFQGLDVSLLGRHKHNLTLTNCRTQQSTTFHLPIPAKMPSIEQGKQYCQHYLQSATTTKVLLSELSSAFSKELGFPISKFVKHYKLAKTPKAFFQSSDQFELYSEGQPPQLFVRNYQNDGQPVADGRQKLANSSKAFTPAALQRVCVGIVKHLLKQQTGNEVLVGKVGLTFYQQYGRSIKTVLKQLELEQSLPTFLQTCENLTVHQAKQQWMVALIQ